MAFWPRVSDLREVRWEKWWGIERRGLPRRERWVMFLDRVRVGEMVVKELAFR